MHGGLLHLGGNLLFLWIFGDNIELKFGKIKFLGIYLAWGVVAGLVHIFGDVQVLHLQLVHLVQSLVY